MFTDDEVKADDILRYFAFEHLPAHLQPASKRFAELVRQILDDTPRSAERTVAFRKLLEAKDAAVRARLKN